MTKPETGARLRASLAPLTGGAPRAAACMHVAGTLGTSWAVLQGLVHTIKLPERSAMKKRKASILPRAAQQAPRPKRQKAQQGGGAPHGAPAGSAPGQRRQQHQSGGGGGKRRSSSAQQQQQQQPRQPAGLRPVSAVHQQAAYAVRRLLEADASKRGGVTLKSLTLGPRITAKKVGRAGGAWWRFRPSNVYCHGDSCIFTCSL